jgi:hypothetical protein
MTCGDAMNTATPRTKRMSPDRMGAALAWTLPTSLLR